MNITRVMVEGVGKFGTRSEIVGLGAGVNILAAGNEAGKSTLFRAVRACLFERHNTKNESVRILATDGLALPVTVSISFDHADQSYTITKSFIKSPAASLMRGTTEIARGREADEMTWELLGIAPGVGRSIDDAAFGILWVGQGQSFRAPEPTEAATTALNTAIQSEVGALVGGERARSVLAAVKAELGNLVTDTGRPKAGGPLAAATTQLDATQSELSDAEARLVVLDGQLNELAAKRAERGRLADPAELARMESEHVAAQKEFKDGEAAATLLSQFETAEQHSRTVLGHAERALADLETCRDLIDDNRKKSFSLSDSLLPIDVQSKTAKAVAQAAKDEIADLDLRAEKDEALERELQRLAGCVARSSARPARARELEALEELERRLVRNKAALAGNSATKTVIASLDKIERELAVLAARLEASAPEVSIEVNEDGAGKVILGEKAIEGSLTRAAVDPLTIKVGNLATIRVSAPAGAQDTDLEKRGALQRQLSKLLHEAASPNATDLRIARTRRQELETEATALEAEITALRIDANSPAEAIEVLKTEIAGIDAIVAEEIARSGLAVLPTADDIAVQQDELRKTREDARRRRQGLDGAIAAQNAILADLADKRGRINGTLIEVQSSLESNLARLPDKDRDRLIGAAGAAVAAARADHLTKAAALEEQRNKAPTTDELERRAIRVDRLKRAIENQSQRLGSLEREIANLEGQVQNAGGDGLGERTEVLREERDMIGREVERHKARVATLALLKDTIEACYKEQRDRLNAPLRRYLQPYLNDVFPSAELELGDGYSITGIRRHGPSAETFERLSAGTQEQIAVLVRLAMGAMLGERGQPVPIILDDALVFSDDDRIEQMFDALSRAGQKQQVIVLTCRTRAFAALGGRHLTISSG